MLITDQDLCFIIDLEKELKKLDEMNKKDYCIICGRRSETLIALLTELLKWRRDPARARLEQATVTPVPAPQGNVFGEGLVEKMLKEQKALKPGGIVYLPKSAHCDICQNDIKLLWKALSITTIVMAIGFGLFLFRTM
ncbi:MAG: hypothetical protein ACEQSB_06445 [Undibacterium sp.]